MHRWECALSFAFNVSLSLCFSLSSDTLSLIPTFLLQLLSVYEAYEICRSIPPAKKANCSLFHSLSLSPFFLALTLSLSLSLSPFLSLTLSLSLSLYKMFLFHTGRPGHASSAFFKLLSSFSSIWDTQCFLSWQHWQLLVRSRRWSRCCCCCAAVAAAASCGRLKQPPPSSKQQMLTERTSPESWSRPSEQSRSFAALLFVPAHFVSLSLSLSFTLNNISPSRTRSPFSLWHTHSLSYFNGLSPS